MIRTRKIIFIILSMLMAVILGACGSKDKKDNKDNHKTTTQASETIRKTAVVDSINTLTRELAFTDVQKGYSDTYSYNNGTDFYTKNKLAIAATQIKSGDVVDIYYDSRSLVISKIQISTDKDVWENTSVTSFNVDDNKKEITVGQTKYCYSESIGVFSNDEKVDIRTLNNSMDRLIVRGYKSEVVSIVVDAGHGYVSLSNAELFEGGLISIGNVLARKIEPGMLLAVTEGEYQIELVNDKYVSRKKITVKRNEETIVDFGDVPAIVEKTGNVRFAINVYDAQLFIDDKAYNSSSIITLKTGKYNIKVTAAGYEDYTDTIEVKPEYRVININLTKKNGTTEAATTASGNKESQSPTIVEGETYVSTKNDVTVKGPAGALIYFDGTYKGIAPVTFDMVTGSHVISVLSGNKINSYTVNLIEGADDVTYDFSDK